MADERSRREVREQTTESARAKLEVARKAYMHSLNEISYSLHAELMASVQRQYYAEQVEEVDTRTMTTVFGWHAKVVDQYLKALAELVERCPEIDDVNLARAIEEPLAWAQDLSEWGADKEASNYLELAKRSGWAACQLLCERWFQSDRKEDLAKATVMLKSCLALLGDDHQGLQALIAMVDKRLLAGVPGRVRQVFEEERLLKGGRGVDPAGRMSLGTETRVRHAVEQEWSLRRGRQIDPAARMCRQLLGRSVKR